MRHLLSCLLLACAGSTNAQLEPPGPLPFPDKDLDLMQGGPAWLVGDHVKARRHFKAAAQRGDPLGQYNLAMMLLHREGGPCDSAQALALLRRAEDAGVGLAGEALEQAHSRAMALRRGLKQPFPCPLPNPVRSVSAVERVPPAAGR